VVDEELLTVSIDGTDGTSIATLVNYAVHPVVLGAWNLEYSGDYPGAVCREIEKRRGGACLFLQGACGDIDPVIYQDRGWGMGTYSDIQSIGERIADVTLEVLKAGSPLDCARLAAQSGTIELPLEAPPAKSELRAFRREMERARDEAREYPHYEVRLLTSAVMLKWAHRIEEAMRSGAAPTSLPVGIQIFGIDSLRLIGLPLELYSGIGLRIKRGLATFSLKGAVVGYANGDLGYCPTDEAIAQGGYGPTAYRWHQESYTAIACGAADKIVAAAVDLAGSETRI
jgi:hypothetical protein